MNKEREKKSQPDIYEVPDRRYWGEVTIPGTLYKDKQDRKIRVPFHKKKNFHLF